MADSPFKMAGFSGFGNSPLKQETKSKTIKEMKKSTLSPEDLRASKDTIVSASDAQEQRFEGWGWKKSESRKDIIEDNPDIRRDKYSVSNQQGWSNILMHRVIDKMEGDKDKGYRELKEAGHRSSKRIKKHYKQEDTKAMSKKEMEKGKKQISAAMAPKIK